MKSKNIVTIIIIFIIFVFCIFVKNNEYKQKQINTKSFELTNNEDNKKENNVKVMDKSKSEEDIKLKEVLSMYKQKTIKTTLNKDVAIVQIIDQKVGTYGSGIIVDSYDGKIIVMTCKHVVNKLIDEKESLMTLCEEKPETIVNGEEIDLKITFFDKKELETNALVYLPGNDIAILTIDYDIENNDFVSAINLSPKNYLFENDDLFFYNMAQGIHLNGIETFSRLANDVVLDAYFGGIILSKDYTLDDVRGASGTGVFIENGALVGMIYEVSGDLVNYYTLNTIMLRMKDFQKYEDSKQ